MDHTQRPAYMAYLPAKVRYDDKLSSSAKLIYAEITALSDATGYCWATNAYLARQFGITPKSVSRIVSQLGSKGYITVEVMRDPATNEVLDRKLWVEPPPPREGTPLPANAETPPPKNEEENDINKLNVIPPKAPQRGRSRREKKEAPDWKPDRFAGFWDYYPRGESKQAAIAAWDKLRPSDALIAIMGQALTRQMATDNWQHGIGIPYASTWLNGSRWEDVVKAPPAARTTGGGFWAPDPEVIRHD